MGNGVTERFNRSLLTMLRTLADDQKADWKNSITSLVHAYNSTTHDSTGHSPFYLMFGRKPRLPIDILFKLWTPDEATDYQTFISKMKERLTHAYELTTQNLAKSAKSDKKWYDRKARGAVPVVGDRVLLKNVSIRGKKKIANKWQKDIFLVVDQPDPDVPVYQIQKESGQGEVKTVHRNLLLPLSLPLEPPVKLPTRVPLKPPIPDVTELSSSDEEPEVEVTVEIDQLQNPDIDAETSSEDHTDVSETDDDISNHTNSEDREDSGTDADVTNSPIPPRRSNRNRRLPEYLRNNYVMFQHRLQHHFQHDELGLKTLMKIHLTFLEMISSFISK